MTTRFERLTDLVARHDSMVRASTEMAMIQVLVMAGTLVNYFRFYVDESGLGKKKFFPSLLFLLNAPSGAGKNGGLSFMRDALFKMAIDNMKLKCEQDFDRWKEDQVKLIKSSVDKEFEGQVGKDIEGQKEVEVKKRVKKLYLRKRTFTVLEEPHGSYEGFAFDRAYMGELLWGAPSFFSAEYGSKILLAKKQSYLQALYDALFELIDRDTLSPKSVKDKAGETPPSEGMGLTLYLTFAALNAGQVNDVKQTILQTAGRRGFILRQSSKDLALGMQFREPLGSEEVGAMEYEINELFDALDECKERCIPFGEGAREYYQEMWKKSVSKWREQAINLPEGEHKEVLCALHTDMARRALKLAVVLAILNHGERSVSIEIEDLKQGEVLTGMFMDKAMDFFEVSGAGAYEKFKEAMLQAKKGSLSAGDVAGLKMPGVFLNGANQEKVLDFVMGELQAEAHADGMVIEHFKNRKQDRYRLVEMDADDKFLEGVESGGDSKTEDLVEEGGVKYFFSYRKDLNERKADGYLVREGEPEDIIPVLKSAMNYGAPEWKGGHRKNANFVRANLIILDYDEGLTIKEAKEVFGGYQCIIATTKSHGVEKNGEVCDRFRVVLFMDRTIHDGEEFMAVMNYMTTKFKADKCKDAGRFYYGNPEAVVEKSKGTRKVPVDKILAKVRATEAAKPKVKFVPISEHRDGPNSIPNFMLRDRHGSHDAKTFVESLPMDNSTHAIFCPWHEDKTPSAFVSHTSEGSLQVTCTVCSETKFISKS